MGALGALAWEEVEMSPASRDGGSDGEVSAYNVGDSMSQGGSIESPREFQSLVREDLWEKEMATHASILAWKIPWTEKPGRL